MPDRRERDRFLEIYLRDHLAAAVAGTEMANRLRQNESKSEFGAAFDQLLAELESDRQTLMGVMERLNIERSNLKMAAAWLSEKIGRLKLNGRLTRRSPLSRLMELEMLATGVEAQRNLWETLENSPFRDELPEFDFSNMIRRCDEKLDRIRELHRSAAEETFAAEPSPAAEEPAAGVRSP